MVPRRMPPVRVFYDSGRMTRVTTHNSPSKITGLQTSRSISSHPAFLAINKEFYVYARLLQDVKGNRPKPVQRQEVSSVAPPDKQHADEKRNRGRKKHDQAT